MFHVHSVVQQSATKMYMFAYKPFLMYAVPRTTSGGSTTVHPKTILTLKTMLTTKSKEPMNPYFSHLGVLVDDIWFFSTWKPNYSGCRPMRLPIQIIWRQLIYKLSIKTIFGQLDSALQDKRSVNSVSIVPIHLSVRVLWHMNVKCGAGRSDGHH